MLKKMLAITLAAVMAIMPMTASAVTWGEVVSGLNNSDRGIYDKMEEEGVHAELHDGIVRVTGTGTIAGDGEENVIVIRPNMVEGGYDYWFEGVTLDADQIKAVADEQNVTVRFREGSVVTGDVVGEAEEEGKYVDIGNEGVIDGDVSVTVFGKDSRGYNRNDGVITGDMNLTVSGDGSFGENENYGMTGGMNAKVSGDGASGRNKNYSMTEEMNALSYGEESIAFNENYYEVAGDMNAVVSGENGGVSNKNSGKVNGDMNVTACAKGSAGDNLAYGGAVGGSMNAEANAEDALVWNRAFDGENGIASSVLNGTSIASNGGMVVNSFEGGVDSLTAVIGEGGMVAAGMIDVDGGIAMPVVDPEMVTAKNVTIIIEAGAENTYTAEQIKAMIEATGMTPTQTVYYTVNADGERTAQYSIGADGSLTFVRQLIEEYSAEELEWIKKQDKIARENHERELKRHAEAIGGVTASPEWVKQLFLGYMSLNLRMYENGEHILFREKLAWVGDGTKNLTLRVNIEEPQALTVRLDEVVLDKLEQAEISLITLLAKDGTPVMQYKVSDLRGAYTQYGLAGTDLLVVGGADDEVMKIGADSEMKPVEAE